MSEEETPLRSNHLLWLDLECTGTDEAKDCIIEIGAILTTWRLDIIWEFQSLVRPHPEGLGRMMLNPVVRAMHSKNGLLDELFGIGEEKLPGSFAVGGILLQKMQASGCEQGKVAIAGSGVSHYDRRFIKKYMSDLHGWCRYWHIDIGTVRRAYEIFVGEDPFKMNADKNHRALVDARCHLEEARAFSKLWNSYAELTVSSPPPPTSLSENESLSN